MKKVSKGIVSAVLTVVCIMLLVSCVSAKKANTEIGIPTKGLKPELITEVKASNGETFGVVFDLGIYETFDEEYGLKLLEKKYGRNLAKAGCTCVVKDRSESGEGLLIGRNMDLSLSDRPLYKFQLNYGKYKAMGIVYNCFSGPTIEEAYNGLTSEDAKDFLKFFPVIATDYLNEKGLYIETDMRNMDYGETPETDFHDSKFGSNGTNPGKGLPNVCMTAVPFYVSTRCATVDEVLDLLRNDINIYNPTTTEEQYKESGVIGLDWAYAFVVADAQGNYGLIEIAQNKIFYTPNCGQTNFYRNDSLAAIEVYPTGGWGKRPSTGYTSCDQENITGARLDGKKSRYAVATENLENVNSVEDMRENMTKVLYSQAYTDKANGLNSAISRYVISNFNPRYEMVQCFPLVRTGNGADDWELDFQKGSVYKCTFDVLSNFSQAKFQKLFQEYCKHHYAGKTKAQLMADNEDYWVTTHSIVTDIDNKTWTVSFFEGDESFNFSIQ